MYSLLFIEDDDQIRLALSMALEDEGYQVREAPDPAPKAGDVRIRVRASGINFADILACSPTRGIMLVQATGGGHGPDPIERLGDRHAHHLAHMQACDFHRQRLGRPRTARGPSDAGPPANGAPSASASRWSIR